MKKRNFRDKVELVADKVTKLKEEIKKLEQEASKEAQEVTDELLADWYESIDPIYDAAYRTGYDNGHKDGEIAGHRKKIRTVFSLNLISEDTFTAELSPKGLDEWRNGLGDKARDMFNLRANIGVSDRLSLTMNIGVFMKLFSDYAGKSTGYIASLFEDNRLILKKVTLDLPVSSLGDCQNITITERGDDK